MSKSLKRRVDIFEAAVRAHEMRGAQPPEYILAIEAEYKRAKEKLLDAIYSITQQGAEQ